VTAGTVTPADVSQAATNCDNTAETLQSQLNSLQSYVEDLESQWHGIASNTFSDLMTDYKIYADMLESALRDIAAGLRGNYVNYSTSEETNIANLKQVNGELPGANFA
jgi:WXG100 family type VII secretion target